jgi:lactate dehydrogenase-like 2-hydroxyacid dehydrogenase
MAPPPSPTHHNIVVLQAQYYKPLQFDLPPPLTCTTTAYPETSPSEVYSRIHDATIIVTSVTRLDAAALSAEVTPYLKLIAVVAVGTDSIDLDACRKRGIVVSNTPDANVESVSEHAIGLYFAARRRTLAMHNLTRAGEWAKRGTLMYEMLDRDRQPPLTCGEEVVGIIGYGAIGT